MSIPRFWRSTQSRYNLIGVKCNNCREIFFPPRKICPNCRRRGKLEGVKLRGEGKVLTYTIIHTAMDGFYKQTPYILAIVELKEGPKLTSRIVDCELDEVKINMPVKSAFRKIRESDEAGLIYYGYAFKPNYKKQSKLSNS